ncbi:type 2 periplasmic-binding domain-containing protein [Paramagnetospirillum marisnigri]|uniref:transporter substrate-binding domain-containing protein n=1 Tax=Paramagnetospirillum marisnigri TaxID=1285242 RepID=UPI001FE1A06C|nr:transporter substrate-binding domain-containing protein [Paramagnetospirillum marisnigri]
MSGASARDLVVGVEAIDYAPVYGMRGGEFIGAAREILDAFARDQGHRLTYRPFPVKRLLAELIHGGIDLKFPDSPDWQGAVRKDVPIAYSKPVIAYIDGTVVRAERVGAAPETIASLGTVAGFTPFAWQDSIKAGKVSLTENPGFEALLKQLQIGRIDGAYANVAVMLTAAEVVLGNPGTLAYAPGLPHIADSYRLSSYKSPEIVAEFDEWLGRNGKLVAEIISRTGAERGIR